MTAAYFHKLAENPAILDYVAFDPGNTTGIAAWGKDLTKPAIIGLQVNEEGLDLFFDHLDRIGSLNEEWPKAFIYEEYRVFNDRFNHQGKSIFTEQVIGQIRGWARRHGVELVKQRPDCLRTGLTWAGEPIPPGHPPDWLSAFGHGYYYLYNTGIIKTSRVLQERKPLGAVERPL